MGMFANLLLAFVVISGSGILGYWASDREPPVQIVAMEPLETKVSPGGLLRIRHVFQRERICHVHIEQVVFDSEGVRYAVSETDFSTAPGGIGKDVFVLEVSIPTSAAKGPARYRGIRAYSCNPLHAWLQWPVILISPDVSFEIDGEPVLPQIPLWGRN